MSANDKQVSGSHYQTAIQPWDYIISNDLGWCEGNVVKYVSRHKNKHGLDDLRKAMHYLEKLIEVELHAEMARQESLNTEATQSGTDFECGTKR